MRGGRRQPAAVSADEITEMPPKGTDVRSARPAVCGFQPRLVGFGAVRSNCHGRRWKSGTCEPLGQGTEHWNGGFVITVGIVSRLNGVNLLTKGVFDERIQRPDQPHLLDVARAGVQ